MARGGLMGNLRWGTEVDPSGVDRGLADMEAKVKATMASLEHEDATVELKADKRDLDTKVREAKAELATLNASHADPKVGMDDAQFQIKRKEIEAQIAALQAKRVNVAVRLDQKGQLARDAALIGRELGKADRAVSGFTSRLAGARVNLGPFSFKLGSLLPVLAGFSSIVVDLTGAIGALAGSLAQASAGALSVAGAGFTGLALSAAGAFFAIKPLLLQFHDATLASTALTKAQLTYGKGSTQAQAAQQAFNNTLQNMSPAARKVETAWQSLKNSFMQRTGGIRQSFAADVTSGISAARALLPTFAQDATRNFKIASQGWDQWMAGLKSPEAQHILDNIMTNFGKALPSIMHGLGQFGVAFARIFSSASNFLGSFTHGFDKVGTSFANWAGNANHLNSVMGDLTSQTHSWFSLLGATGHLLATIFGGGAKAGQSMVDDLTRSINNWNKALSTTAGQKNMRNFFSQSVAGSEQFIGVLRRVVTLIFDVGQAFAPITDQVLKFINAFGDVIHTLAGIPVISQALKAFGYAIGAAFVINRLQSFVTWIGSAISSLGLLGGARITETEATIANTDALALNTEALMANRAAATGAAVAQGELAAASTASAEASVGSTAGRAAGLFSGTFGSAIPAVSGTTAEVGLLSRAMGALGVTTAGLGLTAVFSGGLAALGLYLAKTKANEQETKNFQAAIKQLGGPLRQFRNDSVVAGDAFAKHIEISASAARDGSHAVHTYTAAVHDSKQAQDGFASAEKQVALAVQAHGRNSIQAAIAQQKLDRETRNLAQADRTLGAAQKAVNAFSRIELHQNHFALDAIRQKIQAYRNQTWSSRNSASSLASVAKLEKQYQQVQKEGIAIQDRHALSILNMSRSLRGASQFGDKAAQSIGRFAHAFHNIPAVQKFLVKTDSKQAVTQVAHVANQVTRLGDKQAVVNIMAKDQGANATFRDLQQKLNQLQRAPTTAVIDAKDKASSIAATVKHNLDSTAKGPYNAQISADGRGATSEGQRTKGSLVGMFSNAIVQYIQTANSDAGSTRSSIAASFLSPIIQYVQTVIKHATGGPAATGAPSQKVSRPTVLTGEQAPAHPEFVIATNPAYRTNNVNFLSQAANALGMAIVPMAMGGVLGAKPPSPKPRGSKYDQDHAKIDYLNAQYDLDRRRYDDDIAAGRSPQPTLAQLIGEKSKIIGVEQQLRKDLASMLRKEHRKLTHLPHQIKQIQNHQLPHLHDQLAAAQADLNKAENAKHPNHKRVADLKHRVNSLTQQQTQLQNKLSQKQQQQSSLRQGYPSLFQEWQHGIPTDIGGLRQDIQELRDEQSGVAASAAQEFVTQGQERFNLLRDFGGNFSPLGGGVSAADRSGTGFGVGFGLGAAAPAASAYAVTPAVPASAPAAAGKTAAAVTHNKNIHVENHYAAPPEDPHSWSKGLHWELGAS